MKKSIPIDKEKISERMEDIERALAKLKIHKEASGNEFTKESDAFALASYWLRIALEAVLVIGTHILSRLPSNGKKKDYTQVILSLGDYGVIPKTFADKIKGMAGYRNRLVHLYWEIGPEELLGILKENMGDFEKFINYIEKFVRKN